jgi:MFS family permease
LTDHPPSPQSADDHAAPAAASDGSKGFVAFRHHDFRLVLPAKFFAVVSHHMIMVAIGYQIYDLTGSTLALALVNLTMVAPVFAFAVIIGYVADTFDRRTVLLWCYGILFVTAVALCAITIAGVHDLWPYYLFLTGLGTSRAFFGPTTNALVPNTVPREAFPNAVAWNMTSAKCAQICGPVAGGLIYLLGPDVVYGVSAFTFIFGAFCTYRIRRREASVRKSAASPLKSLFVGISYVVEKRIILGAVVVDVMTALMGGVQALLPVYAKDILDVGASGAGVLRSALALGGLFSALTLTQLGGNRRAGLTMLVGVFIYGMACIAFGLSTSYPLSIAMLVLVGASEAANANVRQTVLQIATPDSLRGRVGAVSSIANTVCTELGGTRAGLFAALMGTVPAVVVGGLITMGIALVYPKVFPELARVQRVDQVMAEEPAEKSA